ncbi:hypothetical protein GY45DRAFT_1264523, partial [Cubamyces sp. BRFM 1775]
GKPCDVKGAPLPPNAQPPPFPARDPDDWTPYSDRVAFELADLLYRREQMSGGNINSLLDLWTSAVLKHWDDAPFSSHGDLYNTINDTTLGDVNWQCFALSYSDSEDVDMDEHHHPWKTARYAVYYHDPLAVVHNMLANPDFKDRIDYAPFREMSPRPGSASETLGSSQRRLENFMGGEWAWRQADTLAKDCSAQDASFVPIILGSDKTTVSVATGQNKYYPLYCSIGNVHNSVRRAHKNAVSLLGFLAIPKSNPWMEESEVVRCGNGHYRKVFYGLGPYIADYPEQALLGCIVQGWCAICLADKAKLEDGAGLLRSRAHTEYAAERFELGELWDEYGIVGDIVV